MNYLKKWAFLAPLSTLSLLNHSILPSFEDLLSTHDHLITIEEHSLIGGLGSILNNFIARRGYPIRIDNFGVPDQFVHHGSHAQIMDKLGLTSAKIFEKVYSESLV